MFEQAAHRLVRRDWGAMGLDFLRGPKDQLTVEQVAHALEGTIAGMRQLIEELSVVLSARGIDTVHSGQAYFQRTDTGAPGKTGSEAHTDMAAPARSLSFESYYDPNYANVDGTTGAVRGGFAHIFRGVAHFCHNGNIPDVLINGGVLRKLSIIGCPNSGLRFGNILGSFKWAKVTSTSHTLGSAGPSWDSYVDANIVTDSTGATATGETVRIYLPRTQTSDPNVRQNDVIQFKYGYDGTAYVDQDVLDGKIGEVRSLVSGTPGDYASGLRGWYLADGTDSTVNLGGGSLQGYTGAGAFTTVGAAITASATGTISAHAGDGSDTAAGTITATGGGTTISVSVASGTTGITISTSYQIDRETNPATAGDTYFVASFNDPGHTHTATALKSDIAGAFTVATSGTNIAGALADHTFTSSTVRPVGIVALFIQRMN